MMKQSIIYQQKDFEPDSINQSMMNQTILDSYPGSINIISVGLIFISLNWFFGLIGGFQDGIKKKMIFSFIFILPFYLYTFLVGYLNLFNFNFEYFLNIVSDYFFHNIIGIISLIVIGIPTIWYLHRSYKEGLNKLYLKKMQKNKWYTLFSYDFIGISFFVLGLPVYYMLTLTTLIILYLISNIEPLTFFLIFLIPFIPMVIMTIGTAGILSDYFVQILYDWSRFIKRYNGKYNIYLNKTNSLIKMRGRCVAICFDETLKKKFNCFQQQFIFKPKGILSNEYIEVIYLKEGSPFLKSKFEIKEGDKIKIFGHIRINWKDSDKLTIIVANHIE